MTARPFSARPVKCPGEPVCYCGQGPDHPAPMHGWEVVDAAGRVLATTPGGGPAGQSEADARALAGGDA